MERDGVVYHAQFVYGNGAIIIGRQGGPFRAPRTDEVSAYVHVTVADVAQRFEQAKKQGAHIVEEPHDMPFGGRQYTAHDLAGHRWTFSQHIADVAPEEWGATAKYEVSLKYAGGKWRWMKVDIEDAARFTHAKGDRI